MYTSTYETMSRSMYQILSKQKIFHYFMHRVKQLYFTHVHRITGKSLQVTCKLWSYVNWLRIHRYDPAQDAVDRSR